MTNGSAHSSPKGENGPSDVGNEKIEEGLQTKSISKDEDDDKMVLCGSPPHEDDGEDPLIPPCLPDGSKKSDAQERRIPSPIKMLTC